MSLHFQLSFRRRRNVRCTQQKHAKAKTILDERLKEKRHVVLNRELTYEEKLAAARKAHEMINPGGRPRKNVDPRGVEGGMRSNRKLCNQKPRKFAVSLSAKTIHE